MKNGNINLVWVIFKALKKIIELPGLNSRTDCNYLAREVLLHCDLIHPSRLVELEQTIYYLKKRKMAQGITSNKGEKLLITLHLNVILITSNNSSAKTTLHICIMHVYIMYDIILGFYTFF